MSSSPTPTSTSGPLPASSRSKKLIVPKVWKRPHSTIYGKNVEFGSSLYSDKIGEINGRKFNSELPWHVRNSGAGSSSSTGSTSQGYLSNLLNEPDSTLIGSVIGPTTRYCSKYDDSYDAKPVGINKLVGECKNYADVLEITNPNRYSKRNNMRQLAGNNRLSSAASKTKRIDFFEEYLNFSKEIDRLNENSLLMNEPLLRQTNVDNFLDFNTEIGLFVPSYGRNSSGSLVNNHQDTNRPLFSSGDDDGRSLIGKKTIKFNAADDEQRVNDAQFSSDINSPFVPLITTTKQTKLLPKHRCQLASSPYGQSADGRKLSLGSINPHSYRPSLPQKTTTVQSSDGEEFEFHDRSSPFFTDR